MKTISISLYAMLRKQRPDLAGAGRIATGAATVRQLLEQMRIAGAEEVIVFVNGKRAAPDAELRDGDRVGVFPILGGG
ncbi:MAG: MoaD/ThiS family protein [Spirochaetales bacterium]|nr:MoaD/ThiS family protein [Spirochaetales bacterium]